MSQFVVSARKYRPDRFENVVGQQHVWQTLKNAIQKQHLAHAFLFCGPRGVGKTTCARILAKVLNCLSPTSDVEPCGVCEACKSFQENASLNVYELDAASNNSVENIRSLIEQVRFPPQKGQYKIYIIDEVHMLSTAAFNAFLKTLEEPPPYAKFILATTEKHKILPTILSRCQVFEFHRITIGDMVEHLSKIAQREGIAAEEDALQLIAQKADGGLRDALSMFDRLASYGNQTLRYLDALEHLNILDYDFYFKTVEAILTEDFRTLLLLFHEVLAKGFESDLFVHGLAEHLRNLLVAQDQRTENLLEIGGNVAQRYKNQALSSPSDLLLSALNLCNECDLYYKTARNKRLHTEVYLMKMAHVPRLLRANPLLIGSSASVAGAALPPPEKKNESAIETAPPPDLGQQRKKIAANLLAPPPSTPPPSETPSPPAAKPLNYQAPELKTWWDNYLQQQVQDPSQQQLYKVQDWQCSEHQLLILVSGQLSLNEFKKRQIPWADDLRQALNKPDLEIKLAIANPPPPPPNQSNTNINNPKINPNDLSERERYVLMLQKNNNLRQLQALLNLKPNKPPHSTS